MNSTQEQWRPIVGLKGLYEISNHGRARSIERTITRIDGKQKRFKGRLLKLSTHPRGYRLFAAGRGNTLAVHKAVLDAFVGPRPEGMECCHNDGDPSNNHLNNLRWDTPSSNAHDTVRQGNHRYGNRTHCKNGHEYTPENTRYDTPKGERYVRPNPRRTCRKCARIYYDRRKLRMIGKENE